MHNPFMDSSAGETFEIDEAAAASLSPGDYIGELISVEKTESKAGNPMFAWTFQVLTPVGGSSLSQPIEIVTFTAITDRAMWKLEETLAGLGLGTAKDGRLQAKFSARDAVGRLATLEIEDSEYNGQTRAAITKVKPHPKGAGYRESRDIPY